MSTCKRVWEIEFRYMLKKKRKKNRLINEVTNFCQIMKILGFWSISKTTYSSGLVIMSHKSQ